jgi:hypothetical protein
LASSTVNRASHFVFGHCAALACLVRFVAMLQAALLTGMTVL